MVSKEQFPLHCMTVTALLVLVCQQHILDSKLVVKMKSAVRQSLCRDQGILFHAEIWISDVHTVQYSKCVQPIVQPYSAMTSIIS